MPKFQYVKTGDFEAPARFKTNGGEALSAYLGSSSRTVTKYFLLLNKLKTIRSHLPKSSLITVF